MESVVMYSIAEGVDRSRVMETYPRHQAYFEAFRADGITAGP